MFAQRLRDTHALLLQQNATVRTTQPICSPPLPLHSLRHPRLTFLCWRALAKVGDVYEAITEYAELMEDSQGNMDLFDFLAARFG